jgi:hypothetical protein
MILDITFFLEQVWKSKRKKNRNKYKLIDEYIFIYWNIDNYSSYCYFFFLSVYSPSCRYIFLSCRGIFSFLTLLVGSCRFLSVIRETGCPLRVCVHLLNGTPLADSSGNWKHRTNEIWFLIELYMGIFNLNRNY